MLRIFIGKAGSGKSAAIMNEIKNAVLEKKPGYMLIVPEQYSHEAERELCAVCGDSLSLYAEVLSFSGLWRKLCAELGGSDKPYLDRGGRLLCMALAAKEIYPRLKLYSAAGRRPELQSMLLSAVDELKAACIESSELFEASQKCEGMLSDKLLDLSYVLETFDSVVANGHADPADKLSVLADMIAESTSCREGHFYFDGFTDFTVQELGVIEALLSLGSDITVCLGCDSLGSDSEIFELSRITARRLMKTAEEKGIKTELRDFSDFASKNPALSFFADNMFSYSAAKFESCGDGIAVFAAPSPEAECEFAAARAIRLLRETGCRMRDIAVAVRGFDEYRASLETAFHRYSLPLFTAKKSDMFSKPLPAMISAAYEIIGGGWNLDDIMDYLRTGLAGLSDAECDILEGYSFLWQRSGSAWTKDEDWSSHPEGYGAEYDDSARERLGLINELRRRASAPLLHFAKVSAEAYTAREQALALSGLFEELGLSEVLAEKTDRLMSLGERTEAQEYSQLWEICVCALEQCIAILGDTESDTESFGKLYTLMLSKYDIGSIPAALDSVTAGDFDRMRRRNIKHLIVIGASEARLPQTDESANIFSDDERRRLGALGLMPYYSEAELWREFSLIYNCLTLPSETLSLCYPLLDASGEPQRESFILRRAVSVFGLSEKRLELRELRTNAKLPALDLAANSFRSDGDIEAASARLFSELEPQRLETLKKAAEYSRGSLSESSVKALYGEKLRLSASKIDKFASCRFSYFMQYGLKAKMHRPAEMRPPEIGTFMHYILENVAREVKELGGFAAVSDEQLESITDKYVSSFIENSLGGFKEKSKRFRHLFGRLVREVRSIVRDTAEELRRSDFEPLSFELDFGRTPQLKYRSIGEGEEALSLSGIADRVDGWLHEGKLYLRVMDYKTGSKSFSFSDVYYGLGLQMLLYLFSLEQNGAALYGHPIVPAGVLYVPAKETILKTDGNIPDEDIPKRRLAALKRSGLILNDEAVIFAMEKSDCPEYIPVSFKKERPEGESLVTAAELGLLSKHIDKTLKEMAAELKGGSIRADPFFRSSRINACQYCDYSGACHFRDGENGEHMRSLPKLGKSAVLQKISGGDFDA